VRHPQTDRAERRSSSRLPDTFEEAIRRSSFRQRKAQQITLIMALSMRRRSRGYLRSTDRTLMTVAICIGQRLIGSIRRECPDRMSVFGEAMSAFRPHPRGLVCYIAENRSIASGSTSIACS
jgi:hypothetical protein